LSKLAAISAAVVAANPSADIFVKDFWQSAAMSAAMTLVGYAAENISAAVTLVA
jgi:hypothetical protein